MAKKSVIFEKQNAALLQENTQLKQTFQQLKAEKQKADTELETLRKRWHYTLIGIVVMVALLAVKIFR